MMRSQLPVILECSTVLECSNNLNADHSLFPLRSLYFTKPQFKACCNLYMTIAYIFFEGVKLKKIMKMGLKVLIINMKPANPRSSPITHCVSSCYQISDERVLI